MVKKYLFLFCLFLLSISSIAQQKPGATVTNSTPAALRTLGGTAATTNSPLIPTLEVQAPANITFKEVEGKKKKDSLLEVYVGGKMISDTNSKIKLTENNNNTKVTITALSDNKLYERVSFTFDSSQTIHNANVIGVPLSFTIHETPGKDSVSIEITSSLKDTELVPVKINKIVEISLTEEQDTASKKGSNGKNTSGKQSNKTTSKSSTTNITKKKSTAKKTSSQNTAATKTDSTTLSNK